MSVVADTDIHGPLQEARHAIIGRDSEIVAAGYLLAHGMASVTPGSRLRVLPFRLADVRWEVCYEVRSESGPVGYRPVAILWPEQALHYRAVAIGDCQ